MASWVQKICSSGAAGILGMFSCAQDVRKNVVTITRGVGRFIQYLAIEFKTLFRAACVVFNDKPLLLACGYEFILGLHMF